MRQLKIIRGILVLLCFCSIVSCKQGPESEATEDAPKMFQVRQMKYPLWVRSSMIYEVNIRQYTPEGTFEAFRKHLPRLQEMGVNILWMMPVYPISITKRKGELGSYYAVADYTKINPEFGTFEEFRDLVGEIHRMNMHVILDWVPNHTGWDHTWITTHPEWYTHSGDTITHPLDNEGNPTDWYDVADLNYEVGPMRNTMIESMKFWLRAADVDGFRCDMAGFVPNDFWDQVRPALEQVKPVFMLAEWEDEPNHFETCFQANYGWTFHHLLNDVAAGKKNASDIEAYLKEDRSKNPAGYYHMNFTSNHDENSWAGSAPERLGDALEAMSVLAFTFEGIPLLYSGQEARNEKRLPFFAKDQIDWKDYPLQDFYTRLIQLKHYNKALWNGNDGGKLIRINEGDEIFAFIREKEGHRVIVMVNCTDHDATTTLTHDIYGMSQVFPKREYNISAGTPIKLKAWEYWVMANPSIVTDPNTL
ncbi:MAG: alpha-amylase [Saprospiraceae bacterium]|nr:alpha-amylase [Saprospiraceae bacterium]